MTHHFCQNTFSLRIPHFSFKIRTGLKQLGFDFVFDTDFAADLTIMEEGTELLGRLKANWDSADGERVY
jgi:iron only hydrogenase large subunit-like protein